MIDKNILEGYDKHKLYSMLDKCKAYNLFKYLEKCDEHLGFISYDDPVIRHMQELYSISIQLDYEEAENLGLSKNASKLRKEWRFKCRQIKRELKRHLRKTL